MICRILKAGENIPQNLACSWNNDGVAYCLRKRSVPKVNRDCEGDFLSSRHLKYYGIMRATWNLSPNVL
jgi:hypothetical protein